MSGVLMAWKGVEGDQGLWWASSPDGVNFDGPLNRLDLNSSQGPALTVFNDRLFTPWKSETSQGLKWASSPNGNDWDNPHSDRRLNSSQGPALTVF
jgi:hypothetical protein